MIKMALLGKNLSHSYSPNLYQYFSNNKVQYDILDFKNAKDIPEINKLLELYQAINITSPYKQHFSKEPINFLFKDRSGNIQMKNTDREALSFLVPEKIKKENPDIIILLGNGVMGNIVKNILDKNSFSYQHFFRQNKTDFSLENKDFSNLGRVVVINTCAREFCFKGKLTNDSLFWDLNYNHPFHMNTIPFYSTYDDGLSLLFHQAQIAFNYL